VTTTAAMIWSPFASAQEARQAAEIMLQEKLVACANILPELLSIFRYEGKVQSASEVGVLFKTEASLLDAATRRLAELHPYDTPAICGWRVDSAPEETRKWLAGLLAAEGK
jgi:periplasmic divalent cation tolerance protein